LLRGERFTPEGQIKLRPGKWYRDTHKALNRLIQGSAADQTKKAMLDLFEAGVVPLVTVHDEIGFSCKDEAEGMRLARMMEDAVPLLVPNVVDMEPGNSWGDSMKPAAEREYHSRAGAVFTAAENK
jgi:DNA polymerase I-like protein with 3'-5' exonuclease and polymerase domains